MFNKKIEELSHLMARSGAPSVWISTLSVIDSKMEEQHKNKESLQEELDTANEKLTELEDSQSNRNIRTVDLGIDKLYYDVNNLQLQSIMESLIGIIRKHGALKVLQGLQSVEKELKIWP